MKVQENRHQHRKVTGDVRHSLFETTQKHLPLDYAGYTDELV